MSNLVQSYHQQSVLLKAQGKLFDAEPLARKYLELISDLHGEFHPDVGSALAHLASIFEDMNEHESALDYYERALAVRELFHEGRDSAEVSQCLQKIAMMNHALDRFDEVLVPFDKGMEMNKRLFGEDHPAVATDLNVLGVLLIKQEQYSQALPVLQKSLKIRERVYGGDHPNVSTALNNLATLYERTGQFDQAEAFFARSLEIREKSLGPEHKNTIHSQNNLTDLKENKELVTYECMQKAKLAKAKDKKAPNEGSAGAKAATTRKKNLENNRRASAYPTLTDSKKALDGIVGLQTRNPRRSHPVP